MIPHIPEKNKAAVLSASRGSGFFAEMRQKSTGNTAQRASGDFARNLLANFPSYCPEKNKAAVLSASRGSGFFAEMRQKSTKYTILI